MGDFERGIAGLRDVRRELERRRSPELGEYLERQRLGAPTWMPGARAFDRASGVEVEVVESAFAVVSDPPSEPD